MYTSIDTCINLGRRARSACVRCHMCICVSNLSKAEDFRDIEPVCIWTVRVSACVYTLTFLSLSLSLSLSVRVCVYVCACVSDLSKAEYVRDVEPGEMVLISLKTGVF